MTGSTRSLPPSSRDVDDLLRPRRKALAALLRSPALSTGDVDLALAQLTEVAVSVLGVERASVWRFDESRQRIECVDLFERTAARHSRGQALTRDGAPAYFVALDEERTIAASDANLDPRTREFESSYLRPLGIGALLDAPIFVGPALVGVVCHEHVGPPREWRLWEELIASTLADFVALVFATAERIASERELAAYREHLEQIIEDRTAKLAETERGLRQLFEASPVPMLLLRPTDDRVLLANGRAAELFGHDVEAGAAPGELWVRPADRERLHEAVLRSQHVDDFEAPLHTTRGLVFAALAVERITWAGEDALLLGIHDVTRQHKAEQVLRQQSEALVKMFAAAPVPFVLTTADDGTVRLCNPRAADLFETTVDGMIGKSAGAYYVEPSERAAFAHAARSGKVEGYSVELRTEKGRTFWALLSAQPIELDGESLLMVGVSDITEQRRTEAELRELAMRDPLTGLFNRRTFVEAAAQEIARADRYGQAISLALVDVDHFKRINDSYGHAIGDAVLRHLADRVRAELRKIDVVARIGGEEFVILMPETGRPAAVRVIERLRSVLGAEPVDTAGGSVRFTVSAGLVERRDREPLDELLQRADAAMYAAKAAGRHRVVTDE